MLVEITNTRIAIGIIVLIVLLMLFTTLIVNFDSVAANSLNKLGMGFTSGAIAALSYIPGAQARKELDTGEYVDITSVYDITMPLLTMRQAQAMINRWINTLPLTDEFGDNDDIKELCNYSLINGKRLRGIIVYEMARLANEINNENDRGLTELDISNGVLAVEYIHSASLVIDDMSYFDNDMYRRGELAAHAKFGPAKAHMGSLVLLTASGLCVSRQIDVCKNSSYMAFINHFINTKLQHTAIGQHLDIEPKSIETHTLVDLMSRKTSTLFEISVILGWIFGGGLNNVKITKTIYDLPEIKDLTSVGNSIGLALQLADDIADVEDDKDNNKNYATAYGIDQARSELNKHIVNARDILQKHKLWSELWSEICVTIVRIAVTD